MTSKPAGSPTSSSRFGLGLFAIYTTCYLAFVLVNAFAPEMVEWSPGGGLNLAVWWGLLLIGLAFVLAMVYGLLCNNSPTEQVTSDRVTPELFNTEQARWDK